MSEDVYNSHKKKRTLTLQYRDNKENCCSLQGLKKQECSFMDQGFIQYQKKGPLPKTHYAHSYQVVVADTGVDHETDARQ